MTRYKLAAALIAGSVVLASGIIFAPAISSANFNGNSGNGFLGNNHGQDNHGDSGHGDDSHGNQGDNNPGDNGHGGDNGGHEGDHGHDGDNGGDTGNTGGDTGSTTPPAPQVVTAIVIVNAITCSSESDLPNWGTAGAPDITSTTASDFLTAHASCQAASGWSFEMASTTASDFPNPGDNVGAAGGAWAAFGPTAASGMASTSVASDANAWVREINQSGFVAFSGVGGSDVSAEIYCNTDGVNYDNFDQIGSTTAGATYYCVAYNAAVASTTDTGGTGTLTIITHVDNLNDGSTDADEFLSDVFAGLGSSTFSLLEGSPFEGSEFGVSTPISAGYTYTVTQEAHDGYAVSYSDDCSGTLSADEEKTCTIINTDGAPSSGSEDQGSNSDDSSNTSSNNTSSDTNSSGALVLAGPSSGGDNNGGGFDLGHGIVLGTSTEMTDLPEGCTPLLTSYMGMGHANDSTQVMMLQTFLNTNLDSNLPLTGVFGPMTKKAVGDFQLKYWQEVLAPWVPYGLGDHTPTGYVYKTTQYKVNMLSCSTLNLPAPQLP